MNLHFIYNCKKVFYVLLCTIRDKIQYNDFKTFTVILNNESKIQNICQIYNYMAFNMFEINFQFLFIFIVSVITFIIVMLIQLLSYYNANIFNNLASIICTCALGIL